MNNKWRYFIIMLLGILMNQGLSYIATPFPVWLDVSGTALAAFMLEPAAGLLVGLVDNFCIALFKYDQGSLIYYSVSAAVAIIVGTLMKDKEGNIKLKRIFLVIPLVIICSTILSSLLTLWKDGGVSTDPFESAKFYWFMGKGFNKYISCFLSVGIIKIYDTIATSIIVIAVYAILPKKLKYNLENKKK